MGEGVQRRLGVETKGSKRLPLAARAPTPCRLCNTAPWGPERRSVPQALPLRLQSKRREPEGRLSGEAEMDRPEGAQ